MTEPKSYMEQPIVRVKLGHEAGIFLGLASILDGLLAVVTFGTFIGGLRAKTSLHYARREFRKRENERG